MPDLADLPNLNVYAPKSLHLTLLARRMVGCIRVSQVNGREGESFMSPQEQEDAFRWWAANNGAEIVAIVREMDKSGKTTERDGLMKALSMIDAGEADGLIVAEVDRFARSLERGLTAVRRLDEKGQAFVAVKNGIEPGMSQTSDGWLKLSMYLLIAELQLRQYTERWETAKRRHVAAGNANATPFGYRKSGTRKDGKPYGPLEPNPATAPAVRFIFERRATGGSWATIATELDGKGIPAPSGGKWLEATVRRIVMGGERTGRIPATGNRVYLGEIRVGQFVNTEAHQALVTETVWQRAVEQKITAAHKDKVPYLLTGLVRCATCGGRMAGWKRTGKVDYAYYRCRRKYTWGTCPHPATVHAPELDAFVQAEFRSRYLSFAATRVGEAESSEALAEAEAALALAEADQELFVMAPGQSQRLGLTKYNRMADQHQQRVDAAQALVNAEQAKVTGFTMPPFLARDWDGLSVERRRGFLSDVFDTIAVKYSEGQVVPAKDRVRIWAQDEDGRPEGLPSRTVTSREVPITF